MPSEFVRIGTHGHDWGNLSQDWRQPTENLNEQFVEEDQLRSEIFKPLVDRNDSRAGIFAIYENGTYHAVCQLNAAPLPGYTAPVMRMRHLTFSPHIDLSDEPIDTYVTALVNTFFEVVSLCKAEGSMKAQFLNFHLPSPSDRHLFTVAGNRFLAHNLFKSVEPKGAWLYIKF